MDSSPITRHLTIRGRVQGVGYRYHFSRTARTLGINGWVRNRRDGSVEAMISGAPHAVEQAIAWAHRGPTQAIVEAVEVKDGSGTYNGFETLATA